MSDRETSKGDILDDDGLLWTYDRKARVWYAPDKGLEFDTVAEIEENYGPVVAASDAE